MLQTILVPVSIVTGAGLIAGLLLSVASKFFAVEVDERVHKIREVLPGANCGACGCAGCDEYAAKMAAGEAEPNLCPVGGAAVAAKLGEILGVSVGSIEPKRAVVRCRGHLQTSEYIIDYDGPKTCQAAKLFITEEQAVTLPAWVMATVSMPVNMMQSRLSIILQR